ncbi:DUF599 domain-containing protein [Thalassomonas sp. M1454]|uniref:DUF599 domain-containing protein n=1 Tax=Thalassomonas sp. M1454 TaxID=2594477 RepID=UPI00117F6938|nr:DUF599 domain-containing protein [Thalassomonas sp. M1454]TRX57008.1 DUF599 domain-containing protein [Thalassomonas sp. M1454]
MSLTLIDYTALVIFFTSWIGYTQFAKIKAKDTACISRCLHQHRLIWMRQIFDTDVRVSHASLLANLERNVAFFASTTMLVLAGVLTLFSQLESVRELLTRMTVAQEASNFAIQIKLCLLVLIFVLAFFQFTWSMRQYGFVNIMIGAAPVAFKTDKEHLINYSVQMARVQDQAAHAYNYGLRSYYFSLSALSWFFHPLMFLVSSLFVVYILYRREFKSKALKAIQQGVVDLSKEGYEFD